MMAITFPSRTRMGVPDFIALAFWMSFSISLGDKSATDKKFSIGVILP
jgi:hypothetical protein